MALLRSGDCIEVMNTFPDAQVDAIVTDPPYGLSREPNATELITCWLAGDDYQHRGGGFMGKAWDSFVPGPAVWRECYRVLKPGGHLLAFAGTRTEDLMGLAIRLAGFERRDTLAWLYGSGFPKSLDVFKAIDKAAGAPATLDAEAWQGWGTALKPAHEPVIVARKPLAGTVAANVLAHGTGALNIDRTRIGMSDASRQKIDNMGGFGRSDYEVKQPGNALQGRVDGTLRPVDSKAHDAGRWPANVILDAEAAAILDAQTGTLKTGGGDRRSPGSGRVALGDFAGDEAPRLFAANEGGASRFFYCAKASRRERNAGLDIRNAHPTVKPIALMRWLCRLVTPSNGIILDPFMGSGTTGIAAAIEGFRFVGIDDDREMVKLSWSRIHHWSNL